MLKHGLIHHLDSAGHTLYGRHSIVLSILNKTLRWAESVHPFSALYVVDYGGVFIPPLGNFTTIT